MSEKAKKQDRRTRYTRQTIKDTFLELLKQKSFTKITVTEICKNAEINRGTFYLHYYDIYDVLSDIFNDMTQDMLTTVDHLFCLTINEQISNFAQTYPTNLKASSNEALLFMRRYRFANCSCFSCCFKDAYPSSNVQ